MIQVKRGQHLPKCALEKFNVKHVEYVLKEDDNSFKPELLKENGQDQSPEEPVKTISVSVKSESSEIIKVEVILKNSKLHSKLIWKQKFCNLRK